MLRMPAGAAPRTCRWWDCRNARSKGWSGSMRVEDILPLSPLQEGLLFHALYDAQAADVYTVQLVLGLQGPLDDVVLRAAMQALVQRHGVLRTGFAHNNLSRPVQVIVSTVTIPWGHIDLS